MIGNVRQYRFQSCRMHSMQCHCWSQKKIVHIMIRAQRDLVDAMLTVTHTWTGPAIAQLPSFGLDQSKFPHNTKHQEIVLNILFCHFVSCGMTDWCRQVLGRQWQPCSCHLPALARTWRHLQSKTLSATLHSPQKSLLLSMYLRSVSAVGFLIYMSALLLCAVAFIKLQPLSKLSVPQACSEIVMHFAAHMLGAADVAHVT